MTIHYRPATLAGSTLLIPRNQRYETKKKPSPPRDVTTQVRDWFHAAGMNETWIEPGSLSDWSLNQRLVLTITRRDPKNCQIVLRPWVVREIGATGLINRLSHTVIVKRGSDLRLIKPFIRLALNQSERRHREDSKLIKHWLASDDLKQLRRIFRNGLYPCEEAVFGQWGQS